jgi:hypothetical protein
MVVPTPSRKFAVDSTKNSLLTLQRIRSPDKRIWETRIHVALESMQRSFRLAFYVQWPVHVNIKRWTLELATTFIYFQLISAD